MSDAIAEVEGAETAQLEKHIPLTQFIADFGDGLLDAVREQNPPIYDGDADAGRDAIMETLSRKPFPAQREVVQAVTRLLIDENQEAAVVNAEMGTGKTMMAIAAAAVMHAEGYRRTLIISPPHLVYKWRREIRETVPGARVWVLNGPDTLKKLLQLRAMREAPTVPEFFILGRVRMRLGFNWKPVFITRQFIVRDDLGKQRVSYAACPSCGTVVCDEDGIPMSPLSAGDALDENRRACSQCKQPLWTLVHKGSGGKPRRDLVRESMRKIPTIGEATAGKLLDAFGEEMLGGMLEDNVFEFINLMDEEGELFFNVWSAPWPTWNSASGKAATKPPSSSSVICRKGISGCSSSTRGTNTRMKVPPRGRRWGYWHASARNPCC